MMPLLFKIETGEQLSVGVIVIGAGLDSLVNCLRWTGRREPWCQPSNYYRSIVS